MGLTQITTGGVDDNINIDSNTLKVDGTNNRVGIGTAAPSKKLEIAATSAEAGIALSSSGRTLVMTSHEQSGVSQATKIGTTSNHELRIITNDTERMRIDSSGNIGIGTSPGTLVDLKGTNARLRLRPAADTQVTDIAFGNAAGSSTRGLIRYDHNSEFMFFETNASERMRIDSLGNVGIGNSNPTNSAGYNTLTLGNGTSTGGQIHLENSSGADFYLWHDGSGVNIYNQGASSQKFYTNASERMRIDGSGNLLVGTTTASGKMTVKMDTNKNISFSGTQGEVGGVPAFVAHQDAGSLAEIGMRGVDIRFATGSSERVRITNDGKLLVGTTSAIAPSNENFAVVSGGNTQITLARNDTSVNSGNTISQIKVYGNDDNGTYQECARIGFEADANHSAGSKPTRMVFEVTPSSASTPTERMRINENGVFNSFTNDHFTVRTARTGSGPGILSMRNGASSITDGSQVFVVRADGDVENTNNNYGAISDIKLKENIIDASSQWDDLKPIQVRKYNFKEETKLGTHTQIGVVAQELELVSPGLVSEAPDVDEEGNELGTTTKSVNYSVLYIKAVKALQEAMDRIETLETKVAALEAAE